jgi:zinc/manganese transport system substrate-binding protein
VRALLTSGPNQFVSPEEYAKIKDDINRGSISLVINARNMGDSRAGQIARELSAETGVKIAYVDIFSASNYSSLLLGDAAIISSTPFIEVESGATCDFTPYWIAIAGVLMVAVVLGYMAYGYRRELLK